MGDEPIIRRMEDLFRREEKGRGAFLSRMFAFFSEEVVRHWAACEPAPYRNLGRPVVWDDAGKFHVLDFTLQRKSDGATFVTEMKCEIEFQGYRFLTLRDGSEIEHHTAGAAFQKLLHLAAHPDSLRVTIGGRDQAIAGSILVWGVLTPQGKAEAMARYGFADLLAVENMLHDLSEWQPQQWADWLATRKRWADELFDWLT